MRLSKKPTLALDTSVVQDNVPQEIVPGIFIGSIHAAFNQDALLERGITHVLNASRIPPTFPRHFTYLSIDIRDKEDANILSCIPASNIFIESAVEAGGVLVHCFGGRSRSAAFVVAFLLSSRGWSYEKAILTVTQARPVAGINRGFERQLRAYQQCRCDVYEAQQSLLLQRVRALHQLRGRNRHSASDSMAAAAAAAAAIVQDREDKSGGSSGHKRVYQWGVERERSMGFGLGEGSLEDEEDEEDERDASLLSGISVVANEGRTNQVRPLLSHGQQFDSFTSLLPSSSGAVSGTRSPHTSLEPAPDSSSANNRGSSSLPQTIMGEGPAPHIRLSRPGSNSVRVIPPLRGLERRYRCGWCGVDLFSLANVVRIDLLVADRDRIDVGQIPANGPAAVSCLSVPTADCKTRSDANSGLVSSSRHLMPPPQGSPKGSPKGSIPTPSAIATNQSRDAGVNGHKHSWPESGDKIVASKGMGTGGYGFEGPSTSRYADSKKHSSFDYDVMDVDGGGEKDKDDPRVVVDPRRGPGLGLSLIKLGEEGPAYNARIQSKGSFDGGFGMSVTGDGGPDETPRLSVPGRPSSASHQTSSQLCSSALAGTAAANASLTVGMERSIGGGASIRPQSAEKRRWLERVNLLRNVSSGACSGSNQSSGSSAVSVAESTDRVALVAQRDEWASLGAEWGSHSNPGTTGPGTRKYLFLEYCAWMGPESIAGREDEGHICCRSCRKAIGVWSWKPSERQCLGGLLVPPLFRILRESVTQTPLALDATPTSTPRRDSMSESNTGSGGT